MARLAPDVNGARVVAAQRAGVAKLAHGAPTTAARCDYSEKTGDPIRLSTPHSAMEEGTLPGDHCSGTQSSHLARGKLVLQEDAAQHSHQTTRRFPVKDAHGQVKMLRAGSPARVPVQQILPLASSSACTLASSMLQSSVLCRLGEQFLATELMSTDQPVESNDDSPEECLTAGNHNSPRARHIAMSSDGESSVPNVAAASHDEEVCARARPHAGLGCSTVVPQPRGTSVIESISTAEDCLERSELQLEEVFHEDGSVFRSRRRIDVSQDGTTQVLLEQERSRTDESLGVAKPYRRRVSTLVRPCTAPAPRSSAYRRPAESVAGQFPMSAPGRLERIIPKN